MTRTTPADITAAVLASFEGCEDARLREIMQALARHLHEFAAEVGLTEREWQEAIRAKVAPRRREAPTRARRRTGSRSARTRRARSS